MSVSLFIIHVIMSCLQLKFGRPIWMDTHQMTMKLAYSYRRTSQINKRLESVVITHYFSIYCLTRIVFISIIDEETQMLKCEYWER